MKKILIAVGVAVAVGAGLVYAQPNKTGAGGAYIAVTSASDKGPGIWIVNLQSTGKAQFCLPKSGEMTAHPVCTPWTN